MNVVWDGDTGTLTVTASVEGEVVDLSATTSRHIIIRDKETGEVDELTPNGGDLANGIVTADITDVDAARYQTVLRCVDADGDIVTYPTPDVPLPEFEVVADIDA